MEKYPEKTQEKIEEVMHAFKHRELKSGKDGIGGMVMSRDLAIAIGIREAKHAGFRVAKEKKSQTSKIEH